MTKMINCRLDDFVSVDQDYKGQVFYHHGEKVKIVDPDHEYFKQAGIYRGYERKDYSEPDIYFIEIKEAVQ